MPKKPPTPGQMKQFWSLVEHGIINSANIQKFLQNPEGFMKPFPVFRTIKLGTGLKTADDFRRELKTSGCYIGDWADDILGKPDFAVASEETEVDLVVLSVAELGFSEGATRGEIYERAKERGLALCPAEVGPQLRLQYPDQPMGEWWLIIAMEPIADSDGDLKVFYIVRVGDGRWLDAHYGSPDDRWNADYRCVFSPRK